MITIGDPQQFALEVLPETFSDGLADIYLVVAGKRVSGQCAIYIPVFIGELAGFLRRHAAPAPDIDFSQMAPEEVFWLFHDILENNREVNRVTPSRVLHYHRLYNLDVAVDGWEIYVFDTEGEKHIVCQRRSSIPSDAEDSSIINATLSREDFISTLSDIIQFFSNGS